VSSRSTLRLNHRSAFCKSHNFDGVLFPEAKKGAGFEAGAEG
jgi:hypothetical protein